MCVLEQANKSYPPKKLYKHDFDQVYTGTGKYRPPIVFR